MHHLTAARWPTLLLLPLLALAACDREPLAIEEEETRPIRPVEEELSRALVAQSPGELVPLIIEMRDMGQARSMAATIATAERMSARGQGPRLHRTYRYDPMVAVRVPAAAVEALEKQPGVIRVHPDRLHEPSLEVSLPWVNADDVHTLGYTGAGLTVAILDTGVDTDHPFFGGRVVSEACYSDGSWANTETLCPDGNDEQIGAGAADVDHAACQNNGANMCGHGTHVAGIAAGDGMGLADPNAPPSGMAPGADIIAIQVFTRFTDNATCDNNPPCVRTFESDYKKGLERVYELRTTYDIAAANMSLGGGQNFTACDGSAVKPTIDDLRTAKIATVASAGNEGWADAVGHPGCISSAITVGSTYRNHDQYDYDNRGPLLDLFAPGRDINSSVPDGLFGFKSGTSMAAPHVTGAFAVMREVYPGATVTEIETILEDTGVPITYDTDGDGVDDHTTPRIDLLAAVQTAADPPVITVGTDPLTVGEGSTAINSGTIQADGGLASLTASVGTVTVSGGAWSWSTSTNENGTSTVTLTATDALAQTGTASFTLVIENVAPVVTIAPDQVMTIDEGEWLAVRASFEDPGSLDTHEASIVCHSVDGGVTVPGVVSQNDRTVEGQCPYGDDSAPTFAVTVNVTDDDGGTGSAGFDVTVNNVDPTVAIDESGTTVINGVPVVLVGAGDPVPFAADATDPGSDDLTFLWSWADGSTTQSMHPLDPSTPDPLPSPDIDPRSVIDNQTHAYAHACAYLVRLDVTDDDGGAALDELQVVVAGTSGMARSHGYWETEYRDRTSFFDDAVLDCYLAAAALLSQVFDEETDASTRNKAAQVLKAAGGDMAVKLDSELLAAWLNFADGAFSWTELVDTDGDRVADTPFADAVQAAEAVRLDPTSTRQELELQKDILESINTMHEG